MILPPMLITPLFLVCQEGMLLIHKCTYIYLITPFCCSTHKIVGISTISRKEHGTAQTRELQCTTLGEVRIGLKVVKVAHDFQQQIVVNSELSHTHEIIIIIITSILYHMTLF